MSNRSAFRVNKSLTTVKFCVFLFVLIAFILIFSFKNIAIKTNYEIVDKSESTHIDGKILTYEVVVNEKIDEMELRKIGKNIVNKAKKEEEFNGININFNDSKEYVGYGASLGNIIYAPDGNIEKANTVKTGDYSNMKFNWDGIAEKDWDKKPSIEEVKIWGTYSSYKDLLNTDTVAKKVSENLEISGKDVVKLIAKDFNLSKEDVEEAILRNAIWIASEPTNNN